MNQQPSSSHPSKCIAVVGPWRSGTSAVTGLLQGFGVYVGNRFYDANTEYCTYEDQLLRKACLAAFDERPDKWGLRGSFDYRVSLLRSWFVAASADASRANAMVLGGKHPVMCMLVNELAASLKACDLFESRDMQFISIERDRQDIVRSWTRECSGQSHWWPRDDIEHIVAEMDDARLAALSNFPHLTIRFSDLRSDAHGVAERLASHFGFTIEKIPQTLARLTS